MLNKITMVKALSYTFAFIIVLILGARLLGVLE
jgi:formate/nitrite transporter FocA (FNT family)